MATCADCEHHKCKNNCVNKLSCNGNCHKKYEKRKCTISVKKCTDFVQIDWASIKNWMMFSKVEE